jgi:hypothetical protein
VKNRDDVGPPMRSVLAILLLSATFAGCLSGPTEPAPPDVAFPDLGRLLVTPADADFEAVAAAPDFPRVVEINYGELSGEPNIGVTSSGGIFITSDDYTVRSRDGGHTWKRVYEYVAAVAGMDVVRSSDPMLWVDTDTDRVFVSNMVSLACAHQAMSDDDGESWVEVPLDCGLAVNDHQKIMTAHPRGPLPRPLLYPNLVYYCYNKLVSTNCAVSYDGGFHYDYDRIAAAQDECGGTNGHPAAAADGTVFVPLGAVCGTPHVAVTKDNGLTWTVRAFGDGVGQEDTDPEITVTPDGTAYFYGRGHDGHGYLWRTHDEFQTVDGPFRVDPPGVKGVIFAGLTSGDDGRLAVAYLGNREYDGDPSDAPDNVTWHLFLTFILDAGAGTPTFATQQVTPPGDPIQIGCIWLRGGGNPCRNLYDFIDAVADKDGRVHVAITDGCTTKDHCADNPKATNEQSRDIGGAMAIQDHGPSLYAAQGLLPSLGWTTQVNDRRAQTS